MAKKGDKRKIIGMINEESGERLYYTTKNTMNTPDKLELKKYSPKLRRHVVFTETKKEPRSQRSSKALSFWWFRCIAQIKQGINQLSVAPDQRCNT